MGSGFPNDDLKGVLIVEDEPVVATNLRIIVENLGYRVCGIAPDGETALEIMEQMGSSTDLLLMDIELSGKMDGIETAERILSNFKPALVYVTSNKDLETIERAKSMTSPYAIISKPFNLGILESTIQGVLKHGVCDEQWYEYEKRAAPRLNALPHPWEKAYIILEGDLQLVELRNISLDGAGVITDMVLYPHVQYPITFILPEPWGQARGVATVRRLVSMNPFVYYGLKLSFARSEGLTWEKYIRHRMDALSH